MVLMWGILDSSVRHHLPAMEFSCISMDHRLHLVAKVFQFLLNRFTELCTKKLGQVDM